MRWADSPVLARNVGRPPPHPRLAATPAESLTPDERRFVVEHFLQFRMSTLGGDLPRARELAARRGDYGGEPVPQPVVDGFDASALRDMQVLFHLAWSGNHLREQPKVAELIDKGREFTEDEKKGLLAVQEEYLAGVLGTWKTLAGQEQVEFGCEPYFHPILPLLCDLESAHEAVPTLHLPARRFARPEDARFQLRAGADRFREILETEPAGGWSPEGAVSEAALAAWQDAGLFWTASDEDVLLTSLGERGNGPARSAKVHTPWKFREGLTVFFRDRELSRLLETDYAAWSPSLAAADFVRRVRRIGDVASQEGRTAVVSVALDGENHWDAYQKNGGPFLEALYSALEQAPIETCTASEAAGAAPLPALSRLSAGSWLVGAFRDWIGRQEKNRAWDLLAEARDALDGKGEPSLQDDAWRSILAAEGSDWFWWVGGDHATAFAADFDDRFRSLLCRSLEQKGIELPPGLLQPIRREADTGIMSPAGPVEPDLDGFITDFYEWLAAGRVMGNACVTPSADCPVKEVYFGRSHDTFYLRLDTAVPPASRALEGSMISVEFPGYPDQAVRFPDLQEGEEEIEGCRAVLARIAEFAVPLNRLPGGGDNTRFRVVCMTPGGEKQVIPSVGTVLLTADPMKETHRGDWFL